MIKALTCILFVLAAFLSLLMLANNPHGGEHHKDLLVGQILWVSYALGLKVFVLFDLPSGAVIVWSLAFCGTANARALSSRP